MTQKLGRYRLVKLLATGGMGEVFLARQEGPGGFAKMVVVKRILRHLATDQGFIDLFLNEAKLAAQLQHPNIAQVFGLEHEAREWFMAMEYVHGHSLRDVLERAQSQGVKVPAPVAVRLASQALQGLHFAHELTDERGRPLGILHRDVSPENLLVTWSGLVKLVDFGIARAMTGAVTRVGRPKGKVAYMAPELTVSGTAVDRRADVYAIGVVLHELLTLERPACVPESAEALGLPRAPWVDNPGIPDALNGLIRQALSVDPANRPASAHELSTALEGWLLANGSSVLPADVAAWLTGLFGRDDAEANPAVVHLGGSAASTDVMHAASGTSPLSAESQLGLAPVAPPPRTVLWLTLLGVGTALVMGFIVLVALWPRAPRTTTPVPVVVEPLVDPKLVNVEPKHVEVEPARPLPVEDAGAEPTPLPPVELTPLPAVHPDAGAPPIRKRVRPQVRVQVRTGRVSLRVNPWAEVYLSGKRLGVTPLNPIEVPVGTSVFTLKNPQLGVTRSVSVKVAAGATSIVKVDLFSK